MNKILVLQRLVIAKRICVLLVAIVLLSSCSTAKQESVSIENELTFSGPYADDFNSVTQKYAGNSFVEGILEDEMITDLEMAETFEKYNTCLKGRGYEIILDKSGDYAGAYHLEPLNGDNETKYDETIETDCDAETGYDGLVYLQYGLKQNPQNQDFGEIMAGCLVRHGLVPEGYTKDDFWNEFNNQTGIIAQYLPSGGKLTDPKYMQCQNNPLDLDLD
jgi:hypothetical protein